MTQINKVSLQLFASAGLTCLALLLIVAPKASATLAGDNGPIVYVETTEPECPVPEDGPMPVEDIALPAPCEAPVTELITTDATGQTPIVVTEESTENGLGITTATISANDQAGNHEIVYATNATTCEDIVFEDDAVEIDTSEVVLDEGYCYYYEESAAIYRVRINASRQKIGEPELVTEVTSKTGTVNFANFYYELSYAPDGKSVVGGRFFYAMPLNGEIEDTEETPLGANYTIEKINLEDGSVTTLVAPKYDAFLNAGYAQNGRIFFTQQLYEDDEDLLSRVADLDFSSNVWYFAANATTATQLTFTPNIYEYFLSASPDSKHVLVCDPYEMAFYIVDTATGESVLVELDESNTFYPVFYSPDGKSFLGFSGSYEYFYNTCGKRMKAARALAVTISEEETPTGVAIAALNKFEDAMLVNGMENSDDWAPIVAYETQKPQVLSSTTTKKPTAVKLQSTGSNAVLSVLFGALLVAVVASTSTLYKKEN